MTVGDLTARRKSGNLYSEFWCDSCAPAWRMWRAGGPAYAEKHAFILHGARGFVGEFRQQSRKLWRTGTGAGLE